MRLPPHVATLPPGLTPISGSTMKLPVCLASPFDSGHNAAGHTLVSPLLRCKQQTNAS